MYEIIPYVSVLRCAHKVHTNSGRGTRLLLMKATENKVGGYDGVKFSSAFFSLMSCFRRDDEALLAAGLTEFT